MILTLLWIWGSVYLGRVPKDWKRFVSPENRLEWEPWDEARYVMRLDRLKIDVDSGTPHTTVAAY